MKVIKYIIFISLIRATFDIFNNFKSVMFNKIDGGDFITIDKNKKNEIEFFNYIDETKHLRPLIFNRINMNCSLSNKKTLLLCLAKKVLNKKRECFENVILVYSKTDFILNRNMEYIIETIKEINLERKKRNDKNEFFFEHIIEDTNLLYNGYHQNQKNEKLIENNYTNQQFYVKKNGNLKIWQSDKNILELTIKLFNIFELTDVYKLKEFDNITCLNTRIELCHNYLCYMKENKECFGIKIEKSTIVFEYMGIQNIYIINLQLKKNDTRINITQKCFNTFQTFLEFIKKQRKSYFSEVELCYRLLESNNLVEEIIQKILNNNESALRLVFINICANIEIIELSNLKDHINEKNELDKILEQNNIKDMARIIMKILKNIDTEFSLIIKSGLFIETENVLNEYNKSSCELIKNLRQIGSGIIKRNFEYFFTAVKIKKTYFNLSQIFSRAKLEKKTVEDAIFKTWFSIFQITSLISGVQRTFNIEDKKLSINDKLPHWFTEDINRLNEFNEAILAEFK
ncbi:uncharacterized protein VNE69_03373 [Vairimorpha necatrix]|uniref:Uncharacterized protein n=1 Tax=Vairimorpha necatrix TaxID=6039 RepID=A0AAX4JB04_9MICR